MRHLANALIAVLLLCSAAVADQAGRLDATFGEGGRTRYPFTPDLEQEEIVGVELQADGRIVVRGFEVGLWRFLADGSIDPSFPNGVAPFDVGPQLAQLPDGRLVTAGRTIDDAPQVMRLTADGALDPTFGTGGVFDLGVALDLRDIRRLALMPDGRIVLYGVVPLGANAPDERLVMLLADGGIDTSFGTDGVVEIDAQTATDLEVQSTGRILLMISACCERGLLAFTPAGVPDPTFLEPDVVSFDSAIGLLPDDRFLAWGDLGLTYRFLPDGQLDPSFTPTKTGAAVGRLGVQPDGRIVTAGGAERVSRLLPAGGLDPSFGEGGSVTNHPEARTVLRQPDGAVVVVVKGFQLMRRFAGVCGNAALEAGEDCDDGNLVGGDGCDAACCTADADGDGWCDTTDSCVTPIPVTKPRIKYANGTATISGQLTVPPAVLAALDPVTDGLRLRITDASGEWSDVTFRPGLDAGTGLGWKVSGSASSRKWSWVDKFAITVQRFDQVKLSTRADRGLLTFSIRSRGPRSLAGEQLNLFDATLPIAAEIVLDPEAGGAGTCGAMDFDGPPPAPTCTKTPKLLNCR